MVTTIGFTRICFTCDKKKVALGGTFNPRMKVWKCAACSTGAKMKWNKGAPSSIGWWPTKNTLSAHHSAYRWWDGEAWSWPAFKHETAVKAAHWASKKETGNREVEWAERPADWPERSRT